MPAKRLLAATLLLMIGCASPADAPVRTEVAALNAGEWIFFGDSITRRAFADPAVWNALPGTPGAVDASVEGDTATRAAGRLGGVLAAHPGPGHVAIALGTNDAYADLGVDDFAARLREIATQVRAAGKTPRFARIPFSPHERLGDVPAYNAAIVRLESELGLRPGPDFFAYFQAHPDALDPDQVHPSASGREAIQRLWAEAARP